MKFSRKKVSNRLPASVGSRIFDVVVHIILILLALVMLYPLWYVVIVSLSHGLDVMQGKVLLLPKRVSLLSYQMVFENKQVLVGFKNSFIYTVLGTTISLVMTTLCAYPLSRPNFYGRKTVMKLVVFTMYFSGGMIPAYLLVLKLKMMDTIWAVLLPNAITTYYVILMRTYFEGISEAIFDAAKIDGASEPRILTNIVIPMSKPIFAMMVLYYALDQWNSFFNALMYMNSKSRYPIQMVIRSMVVEGNLGAQAAIKGSTIGFAATDMTIKYALITLTIIPILLIYPLVQRYFVNGVAIGAVKE